MQSTHTKHDWIRAAARACSMVALAACATVAAAAPEPAASDVKPAPDNAVPSKPDDKAVAQAQAARPGLDFGPAADLGKLEQSRGGTDVHNDMKLDGVVSGNSAINVVTGNNTIDAGAFANMSGIPVVIQNSGANVLIQNATIVNLQFK